MEKCYNKKQLPRPAQLEGAAAVMINDAESDSVGEVLGLYYAIRWVHELWLQNVDFEVDSKRVAD